MGLIQAIPKKYKQIVLENKKGICNDNIDRIMQQKEKVVKLIYKTKLERNKQFPEKAFLKIKALLETEMTRDTFLNYFNLAETATTSNKLREFQYRILHSILTTNTTLKAWNIRNDDKCTFCQAEAETIKHLLLQCNHSRIIWDHVQEFTQNRSGISVQFSDTEIILGISDSADLNIFNLVNMAVKQYIYACRCKGILPFPLAAIEEISIIEKMEYSIALKNDKIDRHNEKWQLLHYVGAG